MKKGLVIAVMALTAYSQTPQLNNGDFEQWGYDTVLQDLKYYRTFNLFSKLQYNDWRITEPVPGFSGNLAAKINVKQFGSDTVYGYVLTQVPYNQDIDSFTIYVKANLQGDSALIMVTENDLLNGGSPCYIAYTWIKNSITNFTKITVPRLVFCGFNDTLVFYAGFYVAQSGHPGSSITIDKLELYKGGTVINLLPDTDFDQWITRTTNYPAGWSSVADLVGADTNTLYKSTDAYSGSYSALLIPAYVTLWSDTFSALLYGSDFLKVLNGNPNTPFNGKPDTLSFAYKLFLSGNPNEYADVYLLLSKWDTANNKRDTLFEKDSILTPQSTWTEVKIPLSLTAVPDSMILGFGCRSPVTNGSSRLQVDAVKFIYQVVGGTTIVQKLMGEDVFYSQGMLIVRNPELAGKSIEIKIYDASGKTFFSKSLCLENGKTYIPLKLNPGSYIYSIVENDRTNTIFSGKLIVRE